MNNAEIAAFPPEVINDAIIWRQQLHQHPELAYDERKTSDLVAAELQGFGLEVHRGLAVTGVVGTLSRGTGGPTIAIRADMDALPIQERTGVPYASQAEGVMHACGHDGHTAILLAAARRCAELPDLWGKVHFVFQPAEEGRGGGRRMVEEGLFELFPCDSIYGLHNWPGLPLGTFVALDGPMMAAAAAFEIEIIGRGCHGAMPHQGTDVVLAACQIAGAVQSIVSRSIDPQKTGVVSVTQIQGGNSFNVIPGSCRLVGTTRWFEHQVGEMIETRLREIAMAVATAFGCEARIQYEHRFPVTANDPTSAAVIRKTAQATPLSLKRVDALPTMASEDFAYMLAERPGCYLLLGSARSDDEPQLHSPDYDFNDALLPIGAALWVSLVRNLLGREKALAAP